jgi:hypothetical protein
MTEYKIPKNCGGCDFFRKLSADQKRDRDGVQLGECYGFTRELEQFPVVMHVGETDPICGVMKIVVTAMKLLQRQRELIQSKKISLEVMKFDKPSVIEMKDNLTSNN